jgi:peroxiredoxin
MCQCGRVMRPLALALVCACATTEATEPPSAQPSASAATEGDPIGTTPPEWQLEGWIQSPPLRLAALRGKVVLARWFTSPSCPHCAASSRALTTLHRRFRERGLVVVGIYHHKDDQPLRDGAVAEYAKQYGFEFPVAIDPEWRTLRRWWLDGHDRDYTSVSFLIDKRGVIRHVHPGGTIDLDAPDGKALLSKVEELLK